jgi:hypothetical protein
MSIFRSSGLKMEIVSTFKSTQRYNTEDQNQHLHHCENLKYHILNTSLEYYCYTICSEVSVRGSITFKE